jgi:non-specific serine/threonine protein kinase
MLTTREREVATLVARGLNNNAIAVRLSVSPQIVQGYLEQLRKKLGVGSKKQIAAWVRSHRGGAGPAGLTRPHGALRDPAV